MKKSFAFTRISILAVAGLATAGWLTLQAQNTGGAGSSPAGGQYRPGQAGQSSQDRSTTAGSMSSSTQVQKANKGSELIGMNVKNAQGETIGEIKDIVIDFQSDRVAYVVLSSDPGVLTAEKLHAVPLRAFQIGSDGSTVTLNADKSKLQSAQGFTKDNWPSPANPTWGAEPFWQESDQNKGDKDKLDRLHTPGMSPGSSSPGSSTNRFGQ